MVSTVSSSQETTTVRERSGRSLLEQQPLVSVIIPYFNHAAYLVETVESVKKQSYAHKEIVVVDDGSTIPVASLMGPQKGVLLLRTENQGVSAARNTGVEHSRGEYLIFLDADDRLLPGAIEAHLKAFREGVALTFGPARMINADGNLIAPPSICRPRNNYFRMFLESNPIACPGSTMISRKAFMQAGRFSLKFRNAEDYHLYLRLARQGAVVQHNSCVADYRKHAGGKSNNTDRMIAAVSAIFDEVSMDTSLTPYEHKVLRRGRKRWMHAFRRDKTLTYKLWGLYYSVRAMLTVPLQYYFWRRTSVIQAAPVLKSGQR